MQDSQFKSDYPNIAALLPRNFIAAADTENKLRLAVLGDRTEYLDVLETLARKTPSQEMRKDPHRLTSKTGFQSFVSEMKAYLAVKHWVFAPNPADVQGTHGEPDYESRIGDLDVEVLTRTSWDQVDNVSVALQEKLNGTPYTAHVMLKDNFIKNPGTERGIAHNEQLVSDIVAESHNLDTSNLPSSISNDGLRIEFEDTGGDSPVVRWEDAERIPLDPMGSIVDQIETDATKQRGGRPILLVYDADVSFLEPKDMRQLLHGTRTGGQDREVSERVYQHRNVWGDYLRDSGYIPEAGKTTYLTQVETGDPNYEGDQCICRGDEGLFADRTFDRIAGVLFIDESDSGHYFPNFYSQKMDFQQLHRDVSRNLKSRSSKFEDLL
ncbi:hypothetical protein [Halorhabdus sp. SVX81]|uniref:hypothetical protein n=1 Tax=Halorhabdus sp. SVX81 TaxID=2978283 RepID=UPI0023DCE536|nr:hypothetical protein [Halorhabdus sp. SVX81]